MSYTLTKEDYTISTDKNKLDVEYIHGFLSQSYWSPGIPVETVTRAVENSLCFGIYHNEKESRQVGFARMVTDKATFAYLADVFVDENYRGRGLAKWMIETILAHPDMQGLRRIMLATKDAHSLYAQFGFVPFATPERWMAYAPPKK